MSALFTEEKTPGKVGKIVLFDGNTVMYDVYNFNPLHRKLTFERHDSAPLNSFKKYIQQGKLKWTSLQ